MIEGSSQDLKIANICDPTLEHHFYKQKLYLNGETGYNIIIFKDSNTPLSSKGRSFIQKGQLNYTVNQVAPRDIYRIFYPTDAENTCISLYSEHASRQVIDEVRKSGLKRPK